MIDEVGVCLKEKDVLACCSLPKALLICHYLIGYSDELVSESYVVPCLGMLAQMVEDSLMMADQFFSVKKMAVQDNGREADHLVDLGPNALNSSEVDLEAADLLEELPMVVAQ